jgi:GTP-binding protein Era
MTNEISQDNAVSPQGEYRAGYVALVGVPNVGKSTLMNTLLDRKISIVTRKPQTTRQRVLGILSRDDAQVIFLDTPGLIEPRYLLHEKMIGHAQAALKDADVILVLTDLSHRSDLPGKMEQIVFASSGQKPVLLIMNKADLVPKMSILPLIERSAQRGLYREIIPISALTNDNIHDLVATIVSYLPIHPPFYPVDMISDHPEKFFVAEFIREKIFEKFSEEIPYSTAVELREYREREVGKTYIYADIIVERESQKGILVGHKGEALKEVGQRARTVIEEFIQRSVFLDLHVKVREHWRNDENILRRLGYNAGT